MSLSDTDEKSSCGSCSGSGKSMCTSCISGFVYETRWEGNESRQECTSCMRCSGSGYVDCFSCGGSGESRW